MKKTNFSSLRESLGNVVSVGTMGPRILDMRQRVNGAAGSNEALLKGIDPGCANKNNWRSHH